MAKEVLSGRDKIIIRGARVNNLKNINIDIPRDQLVVVTGLSGSGKSSLAFDTIYAEGNRRYMEGLSVYARNFLDISAKPEVDKIENLSPSIAIDQRSVSRSPRSTVGTMTEIYDYLRVLFAKIGKPHCSECGFEMRKKTNEEIFAEIMLFPERTQVAILARIDGRETKERNLWEVLQSVRQMGYARVCIDKKITTVQEALLSKSADPLSNVYVVVDRISVNRQNPDKERIIDSVATAMKIGNGSIKAVVDNQEEKVFNQDFLCEKCGTRIKEINPSHFSFNSPEGACPHCFGLGFNHRINPDLIIPNKNLSLSEGAIKPWSKTEAKNGGSNGHSAILRKLAKQYGFSLNVPVKKLSIQQLNIILYGTDKKGVISVVGGFNDESEKNFFFEGIIPALERKYLEAKSDYLRSEIERYMIAEICASCEGKRLRREFLAVLFDGKSIDDLANFDIVRLKNFFQKFDQKTFSVADRDIFIPLRREIIKRLNSLENVGLEYLNLARGAQTISGGEGQRIRLAVQINSQLMGIVYVLDEPSIGLHSRDTAKLIQTMKMLKNKGNSLIIVEHDREIIKAADWIVDMGPGAGEYGGEIIFEGGITKLSRAKNLTAEYLFGKKKFFGKKTFRKGNGKNIEILGASENNLKNINVKIPLGKLVSICGVSGSGKSTLIADILAKSLSRHFFGAKEQPGKHKSIKGLKHIDKVISIDQNPIGRTPRSNAATYTGVFSHIRDIFAGLEEAKNRGYIASRFSFNMRGGRCEACQGEGYKKIEMHLLPDLYVKCESCDGARYNKKTLEIEYKGYNISQILDMDVRFARIFFAEMPLIEEKLKMMEEVGLGYLKLGQSATNLSGGEAQRIKLAAELSRKSTGRTLYTLDEPSIGLHFEDVKRLMEVLNALVDKGNSVLVVEHNLDIVKNSDWVIELGPDSGDKGGEIVFEGAPDKLKKCKKSWTAKYL